MYCSPTSELRLDVVEFTCESNGLLGLHPFSSNYEVKCWELLVPFVGGAVVEVPHRYGYAPQPYASVAAPGAAGMAWSTSTSRNLSLASKPSPNPLFSPLRRLRTFVLDNVACDFVVSSPRPSGFASPALGAGFVSKSHDHDAHAARPSSLTTSSSRERPYHKWYHHIVVP